MPVLLSAEELAAKGEELEKHRGQVLKERYLPGVTAFPDVRELFERLLADGKQIALASSAKQDELETYEQAARIEGLVHVETSSDNVVGDTPSDAEAAGKAGISTIGLLCGGWSEADLKQAGCIATYKDPAELLARFDTSPLARTAA